jgi:hypothetical protein
MVWLSWSNGIWYDQNMNTKPGRQPTSGDPAARSRQRRRRTTIALPSSLRDRLEARGARSDKGHGPYNYTRQLARTVERYDSVLARSDPRQTRDLPDEAYELVVELLTSPLELESFHILHLGDYLFDQPAFHARAGERRIDPQQLRDTLNALPYAEKLHLADAAQVRNAPLQAHEDRARTRRP